MTESRFLKITVLGDGAVGKTCLLIVFTAKKFPDEYLLTVMETTEKEITVDEKRYCLRIWDTAGQEDYDRLRVLAYPNVTTNCFLLCFSVQCNIASFQNIEMKWVPEIKRHYSNVPFILIGTKIDLRESEESCYSFQEGENLGKRIGAAAYLECSALKFIGLDNVFENIVRVCNNHPVFPIDNKSKKCVICSIL